jgi:hypothetical protein
MAKTPFIDRPRPGSRPRGRAIAARDRRAGAPWTKRAAVAIALFGAMVFFGLHDRPAHGETMTCLGACRVEYGACLLAAKDMEPDKAQEHRAECGHEYLRCSLKCKQGGHAGQGASE